MAKNCKCMKLRGRVYIRPVDLTTPTWSPDPTPDRPWMYVGNVPVLNTETSTTEERVKDYTSCCGGDACYREEIDKITLNLEAACFDPDVASIALRGDTVGITAGPKTKTFATVNRGDILPLGPYISNLTVGSLVEGTDYVKRSTHVEITSNAPNVPATGGLTAVVAAWDQSKDSTRIEMYSSCVSKEYELMFGGDNCMDPDSDGVLDYIYRVSISGAPRLDIIAENAGRFTLKGSILSDDRLTSGSRFGTMEF